MNATNPVRNSPPHRPFGRASPVRGKTVLRSARESGTSNRASAGAISNGANQLVTLLKNEAGVRPLLMAHFITGYPTMNASRAVGEALIDGGADILELQIPFSDPMADGPAIVEACHLALKHAPRVEDSFELARTLQVRGTPILLMSYLNPIFHYGLAKFVRDAQHAGVSALIIPDAPLDSAEGRELLRETKRRGMFMIPVISPGVSRTRLKELAHHADLPAPARAGRQAGGFVYCTSRQGITGANSKFVSNLTAYMRDARNIFRLPLGLGFGVRTRADFNRAAKLADVVIAGSVFVEAIKRAKGAPEKAVEAALRKLLAR